MDTVLIVVLLVVLIAVAAYYSQIRGRRSTVVNTDHAKVEARRWIDRLGGQLRSLDGGRSLAATQALADASERFTAAGTLIEQATTAKQARLAQQSAYEGLYYVRAARTTLGMDPGPEIPALPGQGRAGTVTEDRQVDVDGRSYQASPHPGERTPHFHPGGVAAGKPVPCGWYSGPWWTGARTSGVWGADTNAVAGALLGGMVGVPYAAADGSYAEGFREGRADGGDAGGDGDADRRDGDSAGEVDF